MPNLLQTLRDTYSVNPAAARNMLPELFQQYEDGLIKVLPPDAKGLFLKCPENVHMEDICAAFVSQWNSIAAEKAKGSET